MTSTPRYLPPILALAEGWQTKLPAALLLAAAASLLNAPVAWALSAGSVAALISLDLTTGLAAARRRGQPVSSAGLRRTIVKTIGYGTFTGSATALAAALRSVGVEPAPAMLLPLAAFAYVAATELRSVAENVSAAALRTPAPG